MHPWLRVGLMLVGAFLFLNGVFRALWAFWEWACMVSWKERPAVYADGPRVYIGAQLGSAAVGAVMFVVGLLW